MILHRCHQELLNENQHAGIQTTQAVLDHIPCLTLNMCRVESGLPVECLTALETGWDGDEQNKKQAFGRSLELTCLECHWERRCRFPHTGFERIRWTWISHRKMSFFRKNSILQTSDQSTLQQRQQQRLQHQSAVQKAAVTLTLLPWEWNFACDVWG